jgi:hypothetical protein
MIIEIMIGRIEKIPHLLNVHFPAGGTQQADVSADTAGYSY